MSKKQAEKMHFGARFLGHFIDDVGISCSIRSYANVSAARDGVRPSLKLDLQ